MTVVTKGVGPLAPGFGPDHTSPGADVILLGDLAHYPGGIDGGGGIDELRWDGGEGETLALDAGLVSVERVAIGTGTGISPTLSGTTGAGVDASDVAYALVLWGNDGDNELTGGRANDTIVGGGGDDVLYGGGGANTLNGGFGDDIYVALETDAVVEVAGNSGGFDTVVFAGAGFAAIPAYVEVLSLPDHVGSLAMVGGAEAAEFDGNDSRNRIDAGAGDDSLYGYGGDDLLLGGSGDDWLDGGRGADVMEGGPGHDDYWVGSFYDQVVEAAGGGFDIVHSMLSAYVLPDQVEGLALEGSAARGIGNGLDNLLAGNALANLLAGREGADTLHGGGGDDSLEGGVGNDAIDGGSGFDVALYPGPRSAYGIDLQGDTVVVTGPAGVDRLTGVEFARFDDQFLTLPAPSILSPLQTALPDYVAETLDSGGFWHHEAGSALVLRFSFMTAAPSYGRTAEQGSNFAAMTADQQEAVRAVLQTYETLLNIDFQESADSAGIEMRFARNFQSGSSGYAYLPLADQALGPGNDEAGDVWLDRTSMDTTGIVPGGFTYETLIHEVGHALGLKHPFVSPSLAEAGHADQDTTQFTVMSYTDRPTGTTVSVTESATERSIQAGGVGNFTPMIYDIAVLQGTYGANTAAASGNDTYSFAAEPFFRTLWDAGGTDTVDAAAFDRDQVIDLLPGHFSSVGVIGFQLNGVWQTSLPAWFDPADFSAAHPEWFTPTYGVDNLSIAFGTIIENAIGGAGDDLLVGNAAANHLTGGAGADTFVFNGPGQVDTVEDFAPGADKLAFDGEVFAQLGAMGPLPAGAFRAGMAAADADDRLLYDGASGALYYDADGTGATAPIQVAVVTGHPVLTAADVLIV
ncbi:MAG: M10 family metallopeptidase C-terminal domain-containing protein [Rhodocyclaceae bacterium]|nr:M10 family metallopeptidase C-terminal domain-containing protein [Rhodocyclaceae bacterium]